MVEELLVHSVFIILNEDIGMHKFPKGEYSLKQGYNPVLVKSQVCSLGKSDFNYSEHYYQKDNARFGLIKSLNIVEYGFTIF